MANLMSPREYLQYHANNHGSQAKRNEAQALLNKMGDDWKLDGNFLTGERRHWWGGTKEQQSNGFNASTLNRTVLPWWHDSYNKYAEANLSGNKENSAPSWQSFTGTGYNAQAARDKANEIAAYDYQITEGNKALGRLDGQLRIGEENALKARNNALTSNQNSYDQATGLYHMHTQDAINRIKRTRDQVEGDTADKIRSARSVFAAGGAGDSSFAKTLAPFLIAKEASKQQGLAQDAYARNRRDMDINYTNVTNAYKKNKDDIENEYTSRLNAARQKIQEARARLTDQVRQAEINKKVANGSNLAAAQSSQQGLQGKIDGYNREIDELSRDRSIPVKEVAWKAPRLDSYEPKEVNVRPDDQSNGTVSDQVSPNLQPLLNTEEKKKKEAWGW